MQKLSVFFVVVVMTLLAVNQGEWIGISFDKNSKRSDATFFALRKSLRRLIVSLIRRKKN